MTYKEKYKAKLDALKSKRGALMRRGRYIQLYELDRDIAEVERHIAEADAYEESMRPKPLIEIMSREKLDAMGIKPLMVECYLIADFLNAVTYEITDICRRNGLDGVTLVPELRDVIRSTEAFTRRLTKTTPALTELITGNDTLNEALHKKCLGYIQQRLK